MEAVRDNNRVAVGLGVSSADETTTLPMQIDAATGRLLISVTAVAEAGGEVATIAPRDGNHVPAALGLKSDDSGVAGISMDNRSGNLYLDLELT
jgi:hypothetical protein